MTPVLLAINFHYVGMQKFPFEGLHSLSESQFKLMLEDLGKFFNFVDSKTLIDLIENNESPKEALCAITFDDGLACQWDKALPILDSMSIPATFFVSGQPLAEKKALTVHKLHWLRAHLSQDDLSNHLMEWYTKISGQKVELKKISEEQVREVLPNDPVDIGRLKFWLHYQLDEHIKTQMISRVFEQIVDSEVEFVKSFYMQENQLYELHRMPGHTVGGHGYSHHPMSTLSAEELKKEVLGTREIISKVIKSDVLAFSYPHGSASAVSMREAKSVLDAGYRYAYTMERAFNGTLQQPGLLARIDCIETAKGKRPLYDYSSTTPRALGFEPLYRTRYLNSPDIPN